jgi:hypothetical protein
MDAPFDNVVEAARAIEQMYTEMQTALPALVNKPGWDIVQQNVRRARATMDAAK